VAPRPYGVLAVARGFEREEAKETLLHEAMHGLFYTCAPFEAACWAFWQSSLSEPQRDLWRAFLGGLGYDGTNEELAVNEFQVRFLPRECYRYLRLRWDSQGSRRRGCGAARSRNARQEMPNVQRIFR
jgi:hypothetical protein